VDDQLEAVEVADEGGKKSRFSSLSTRGAGSLDRVLLVVGGVLIPLGLLLIILGWVGSSRTPFVFEQVPYVISGGLLGLALVFGGGFVYFAYWQTRALRDARDNQRQLVAALDEIKVLLGGSTTNGFGSSRAAAGVTATSDQFVSTEKGTMFHRADCPVTQGREKLRTVRGDEPGLRPCGICNPLVSVG